MPPWRINNNHLQMNHVKELRENIEISGVFSDYRISEDYAVGSNGVIYFANAKSEHQSPSAIALKTVLPQNISGYNQFLKDLEREFGKWLKIPPHMNILRPRGFKKIQYFGNIDTYERTDQMPLEIPIMEMEWADGSLRDWITNERYTTEERIIALIYSFNGLAHLYKNGVNGHGDLKPENILFTDDTPKMIHLGEEALQGSLRFIAKIADFGLSDIWEENDNYHKGAREYLAPERLVEKKERKFVIEKSDMFSMGVIAAELILSKHPSKNLKKMKKSDGNWVRGCNNMDWDLAGIDSIKIKDLITRCLSIHPKQRPTASTACETLIVELKERYGIDLRPFIDQLNENEDTRLKRIGISTVKREFQNEISLLSSTIGLSANEDEKTAKRLEEILRSISFDRLYRMLDWTDATGMLKDIYRNYDKFSNRYNALTLLANDRLTNIVAKIDAIGLQELHDKLTTPLGDPIFSAFVDLVGRLTSIAHVNFEQIYGNEYDTTDYFTSAFACSMFGSIYTNSGYEGKRSAKEFLEIARNLNPECDYIHFKIAKYNYENLLLKKIPTSEIENTIFELITAIKRVKKINPNWVLGNNLLNSICKLFKKEPAELLKLVP